MTMLLLVDDNKMLADVYAEGLTLKGFEVITTYSGPECLESLETVQPDIILLDIMMPGMDGWETLQRIRKLPQGREIPVLIVTAKALLVKDLAAHGDLIDGFLLKPFTLTDLAGRIRDFERKRGDLAACVQKGTTGADSRQVMECAELARQVAVQKKLTDRLVADYEMTFAGRVDGEEIPEVVRELRATFRAKEERLAELAAMLGILEEPRMQEILKGTF